MKQGINFHALSDIIDAAQFFPENKEGDGQFKNILKKSIAELSQHCENVIGSLEDKILAQQANSTKILIPEIALALITDKKLLKSNNVLTALSTQQEKILFLDADYDEVRSFLGDIDNERYFTGKYFFEGKQHDFKYKLSFYNDFLSFQKILLKAASIYNIANPILFAPFLRKSFSVIILNSIPEDAEDVNYMFQENNIPVIEEAVLASNLQKSSTKLLQADAKTPYNGTVRFIFRFEKSKTGYYKLALPKNNQTLIYDINFTDEALELTINKELEEFLIIEYRQVNWDDVEMKRLLNANRMFCNYVEISPLQNKRIISQSDIYFAVSPFKNFHGVQCEVVNELNNVCVRYSSKYCVKPPENRRGKIFRQVKLKFSFNDVQNHPRFIIDYINFVIMYLEYFYPEIEWIGGF